MINTWFVDLRRSNWVKYHPRGKKAELCTGCWLVIFLSLFFIACGLMNETHTIATKETKKNGHQKRSSVPIYLPLQLSTATALPVFCTYSPPPPSWSLAILSNLHLNLWINQFFLSFSPPSTTALLPQSNCPFSSSLSWHFARSEPIRIWAVTYVLQTLSSILVLFYCRKE